MIDLDANSTTTLHPAAWDAFRWVSESVHGNPSSIHSLGRRARQVFDDAKERIAKCVDCRSDEIIITSGATEANNLAIFGLVGPSSGHIITSMVEHPCVVEPIKSLEKRGFAVTSVMPDSQGFIHTNDVMAAIRADTRLIAVMLANHETGAVNDIAAIEKKVPVHTDAAQAIGKRPVSFRNLGVTSLSASAHKFGGPKGVGFLILKHGTKWNRHLHGGPQQENRRPGTESVALTMSMTLALECAVEELAENTARLRRQRQLFFESLKDIAVLNGPLIDDERSMPGTLNLSFPGCRSDLLLMTLDQKGIMASAGSACASGAMLPSPVLTAMGLDSDRVRSAVRFSWTSEMTDEELVQAAELIRQCVNETR